MVKKIEELTDEELSQEVKKMKSSSIYDALIIGFLIGVAIYSSVKNGIGLLSFLPLVYIPIAAKNKVRNHQLKKQFDERHSK
ncbi:FUSC family protein [Marinigracilibium pacificum]|uniref:FUSC family protein n=1 Tax=Marinigracilibium pacificum TaxID=2729599 RepID=A0A848JCS5_9BACT|nr:FUSC family protein [Marinigracilibium pacificum]NMM50802.1 FUSC family protein [Marinigracilibium pacificum]